MLIPVILRNNCDKAVSNLAMASAVYVCTVYGSPCVRTKVRVNGGFRTSMKGQCHSIMTSVRLSSGFYPNATERTLTLGGLDAATIKLAFFLYHLLLEVNT